MVAAIVVASSASSVGDAAGSAGSGCYHQVPPGTPALPRVRRRTEPPVRDPILSVQEASQRRASIVLRLLGHAGIRYPVEAVICPRIHVELDRHPGAAQSIRIDHVFFEEEIETADRN